ncbi:hypothetical protein I542_1934 [Mycobacteroides abscessus 1948]|uniref:Uncharacterized protein n=1 Tax=Mycobacteroides abscessus 1948 TaxID=1299323 RepID=A0A829QG47_9MYCO|nr:hypothetical protein I542_1934 [Mycobacteroides abscessus 1948]
MSIGWSWSADLDTTTLYGLLRLRAEAFIVGQKLCLPGPRRS